MPASRSLTLADAKRSIVRVGSGRGFVAEVPHPRLARFVERVVITAAHCLPELPPPHPAAAIVERTHGSLIGVLSEQPAIACEVLFADPISDVAILGTPDDQELSELADAYSQFVESVPALRIGSPATTPAWRLSLCGKWIQGTIQGRSYRGITADWKSPAESGMSGSPIIQSGRAVGLVSVGNDFDPVLMRSLPGWSIAALTLR